jgi:glycine/D-amino acid oxidase-like deaminating enzyme
MTATADVVVIGAGIVGAACADCLSAEGLRVAIIEASFVAAGATSAGMGHIVVMDDSEAQFALTRYSRDIWNELAAESPSDVEFERRGTLWIAADEEEMQEVRRKLKFCSDRGVRAEMLDARALAEAEPNLRPGLAGALLVPDDSVIYAPCAARWFVERAARRGAALFAGSPATEIAGGSVRLGNGTHISCAAVVCATGTWASGMFDEVTVRPRKGHLAITDRYPGFLRHQLVELGYLKSAHGSQSDSVAFNLQPRSTGQILIGSSRQFDVTHSAIDRSILTRMLDRAIEYMPGLERTSVIRTWTGFRASTPDNLPLIGPCPGRSNIYLATGHEGLGMTTSLGTAQLIKSLVTGKAAAIPSEPYLPGRLQGARSHA